MAIFLGIAVQLMRREALRTAAPWLALGAYVIGRAVIAAAARSHLRPEHALDSRCTTVSVILLGSLIGLVASMISQGRTQASSTSESTTMIVSALVGSLLTLSAMDAPSEFDYFL